MAFDDHSIMLWLQACTRLTRQFSPDLSGLLLKKFRLATISDLFTSILVSDLVIVSERSIRPKFDPMIDIRMALDHRLSQVCYIDSILRACQNLNWLYTVRHVH